MMTHLLQWLTGVGVGAGLTFFLDPVQGKRRRALVRDQAARATAKTRQAANVTVRDARNRLRGLAAEVRSSMSRAKAPDDVVAARVRSKMGHYVSHPSSIEVSARDGQVTLNGRILSGEVGRLLSAIRSVPGVSEVENRLEVHETAENHPELQGGAEPFGQLPEFFQARWSPAARALAGITGFAMVADCIRRGSPAAIVLGTFGFGLFVRAVTNQSIEELLGPTGRPDTAKREDLSEESARKTSHRVTLRT